MILVVIIFAVLLYFPANGYAYVDPGAGSLFLQLLLGGIAGLFVILKLYWKKLTALFLKRKKLKRKKDAVEAQDDR